MLTKTEEPALEASTPPASEDVMVDIESLSTHKWNAVVLAVAAVGFSTNNTGPTISDSRMFKLAVVPQLAAGREIDQKTVKWWAAQKDAWHGWEDQKDATSLFDFCTTFGDWYRAQGFKRIWARGICFDLGNLDSLFEGQNMEAPWTYNAPMDQRSTLRVKSLISAREQPKAEFPPHHPAGDCYWQIWDLWRHGVHTSQLT